MVPTGLLQVVWLSTLLLCAEGLWQRQATRYNVDRTDLYMDCRLCTDNTRCPHCVQLFPAGDRTPTDLGADHYPRFVQEVTCDAARCEMCLPPFECRAVLFPVPFLMQRKAHEAQDFKVPSQLRSHWKFEEVPLSVGCTCAS